MPFLRSQIGERIPAIKYQQDHPPQPVIDNLTRIAAMVKRIENYHCIRITSGYRCEELNRLVGGSKSSAHLYGRAVDFEPRDETLGNYKTLVWWINDPHNLAVPFDKMIMEYGDEKPEGMPAWIHLQVNQDPTIARRRVFRICKKTKGVYVPFDIQNWQTIS